MAIDIERDDERDAEIDNQIQRRQVVMMSSSPSGMLGRESARERGRAGGIRGRIEGERAADLEIWVLVFTQFLHASS